MVLYHILTGLSVLFLVVVLFAASGVQAQEESVEDFIACLPDVFDARIKVGDYTIAWVDFDEWESLHELSGRSLWIGYENGGWDLDEPVFVFYTIEAYSIEDYSPIEIWIALGETEWYWFPFANTELFADANGDHYGMHPCGGFAVDAVTSRAWIWDILNGD